MALTYHSNRPFKDVEHFINQDGQYIFCRQYKPESEVRGLVLLLHGYAEHCGRFEIVAKMLNELDLLMITHDHYCHGESDGKRGDFSYQVCVRDVLQHAEIIKNKYPSLPLYIYGHSMGGGLAIAAVRKKTSIFKGMILSAPMVALSTRTATPFRSFVVKLVASVFPSLKVSGLKLKHLSRDLKAQKEYAEDPMVYRRVLRLGISARTAREFLRMMNDLSEILQDIKISFVIGHGDDDKICDISGSQSLLALSKSDDKKLFVYSKMRHQLEHEIKEDTEKYLNDVKAWLSDHLLK